MSNLGMTVFRTGCGMTVLGGMGMSATTHGSGAAGNGLLNNLIAYWPGNEANGNALDAHTNNLDLTDVNTVTSNPGVVYPLARQYTRANNEYHTRPGDDALLSLGDTDFTAAAWVYQDSKPGAGMRILAKDNLAPNGREYQLLWLNTTDRYRWTVADGTNLVGDVSATTFGAPVLSTWYLIICWHDATANTISIQVNNGGVDSAATTGVPGDTVQPFTLGATSSGTFTWDGRIGPTAIWKSAAGGGGVLTAAQRTALYNGGAGLTYAALTA